jgi:hypothetical protein
MITWNNGIQVLLTLKLGFLNHGTTPKMMVGHIGVVTNYFESKLGMVW